MLSRLHNATFNAWNSHAADAGCRRIRQSGNLYQCHRAGQGSHRSTVTGSVSPAACASRTANFSGIDPRTLHRHDRFFREVARRKRTMRHTREVIERLQAEFHRPDISRDRKPELSSYFIPISYDRPVNASPLMPEGEVELSGKVASGL